MSLRGEVEVVYGIWARGRISEKTSVIVQDFSLPAYETTEGEGNDAIVPTLLVRIESIVSATDVRDRDKHYAKVKKASDDMFDMAFLFYVHKGIIVQPKLKVRIEGG
jgi:hypothetical protein